MTNTERLLAEIRKAEQDGILAITNETPESIETDDFELDKPFTYRLAAPGPAWYAERIKFVSDEARRLAGHLKNVLPDLLSSLDPDMTRTLTAVYMVAGYPDIDAMCKLAGTDPEEIPEMTMLEDGDGCIGCLWSMQSAIILDLLAIQNAADEVCRDGTMEPGTEFDIGVETTLTHEIYHLAAADPFLDLEGLDNEELAAEEYGILAYEAWRFHAKQPNVVK